MSATPEVSSKAPPEVSPEVAPKPRRKVTPRNGAEPLDSSDVFGLIGMIAQTYRDTKQALNAANLTADQLELWGNALQRIERQLAVLGPLYECFEESNRRQEQLGEAFRMRHFIEPLGRLGCMLHDDLGDAVNDPGIKTEDERALIKRWTGHFRRLLLTWLAGYGIEPIEAEPGSLLDPTLMLPIGQVEATQGEGINTVAQTLQAGFRCGERVLRPCRVSVYRDASGSPACSIPSSHHQQTPA